MEKEMSRKEMVDKIKAYGFAITDISLYLDTHPEDEKALCLHRNYCKKWRWLEEPWPWERGNY